MIFNVETQPVNEAMKLPALGHLLLDQNLDYRSVAMFEKYYTQSETKLKLNMIEVIKGDNKEMKINVI